MTKKIAGVLLDIDGTLVDSNDANARAWMEAMGQHGVEVNYVAIRQAIGMGGDNLLPQVAKIDGDSPKGKAISKTQGQIFSGKYLPRLHAFAGVRGLLTRFQSAGLTLVVATSSKPEAAKALLEIAGSADLVSETATTEDAEKSKPNPDILHAALQKSGLSADEVIMLADTPYDVQAAQKVGVGIVGVRCGGWTTEDLTGTLAVYDDPRPTCWRTLILRRLPNKKS